MSRLNAVFAFLFTVALVDAVDHSYYNCITENNVKRDVIVQLMEWRWADVASECKDFLGPKGFCAVQVSPPQEHRITSGYPWSQRYEVVSYLLNKTRSGTNAEFADMITQCYEAGVRVYVDAVINHMTTAGSDTGSAGSSFDGDNQNYPAVPYYPIQFNGASDCPTSSLNIENMFNLNQVKNCRLNGLRDIKLSMTENRALVKGYLDSMVDMGVAGFRVDSAKHMWTADLEPIYDSINILRSDMFPSGERPFIYQDMPEKPDEPVKATEYVSMGQVEEYRYGSYLGQVVRNQNGLQLKDLHNFGNTSVWNLLSGQNAVSFVDNHDSQRYTVGGDSAVLSFKDPRLYRIGNIFALAWNYGYPRVMSSYNFTTDNQGPPADSSGNTLSVPINSDGTCGNNWVCEHRWSAIANMVEFHNVARGEDVRHWWDNGANQIAFGRGEVAFVAINLESDIEMSAFLETSLFPGTYCDVISGSRTSNTTCSGKQVLVDLTGYANFYIPPGETPAIAIHRDSVINV